MAIPGADEYEGIRLDGTLFDIEVNGEYIRDSEVQISGLILVSRDISDRKKAIEAGCNDYIVKPIRKERFMELTRKYF